MRQTGTPRPVGVDAYLLGELASKVWHEFVNGEVVAMVGASKAHNSICVNLIQRSPALQTALRSLAWHAEEICGECVPRTYAPTLIAWTDGIQKTAREIV